MECSSAHTSGDIIIDGVSTSTLGLHELRSAIGIIPQEPSLFAGSLRRNIDPFGEISDEELWQALDAACLKKAVEDMSGGLNATISEEGLLNFVLMAPNSWSLQTSYYQRKQHSPWL